MEMQSLMSQLIKPSERGLKIMRKYGLEFKIFSDKGRAALGRIAKDIKIYEEIGDAAGAAQARAAYEDLYTTLGKFKPLLDILLETQKITSLEERRRLIGNERAWRSYQKLIQFVNREGIGETRELLDRMGTASDKYEKRVKGPAQRIAGAFSVLLKSINDIALAIGTRLEPGIVKVIDKISAGVRKLADRIRGWLDSAGFQEWYDEIEDIFSNLGVSFDNFINDAIEKIGNFGKRFKAIWPDIRRVAGETLDWIKERIGLIQKFGLFSGAEIDIGFKKLQIKFIDLQEWAIRVGDKLWESLKIAGTAFGKFMMRLIDGIGEFLKNTLDWALKHVFNLAIDTISNLLLPQFKVLGSLIGVDIDAPFKVKGDALKHKGSPKLQRLFDEVGGGAGGFFRGLGEDIEKYRKGLKKQRTDLESDIRIMEGKIRIGKAELFLKEQQLAIERANQVAMRSTIEAMENMNQFINKATGTFQQLQGGDVGGTAIPSSGLDFNQAKKLIEIQEALRRGALTRNKLLQDIATYTEKPYAVRIEEALERLMNRGGVAKTGLFGTSFGSFSQERMPLARLRRGMDFGAGQLPFGDYAANIQASVDRIVAANQASVDKLIKIFKDLADQGLLENVQTDALEKLIAMRIKQGELPTQQYKTLEDVIGPERKIQESLAGVPEDIKRGMAGVQSIAEAMKVVKEGMTAVSKIGKSESESTNRWIEELKRVLDEWWENLKSRSDHGATIK